MSLYATWSDAHERIRRYSLATKLELLDGKSLASDMLLRGGSTLLTKVFLLLRKHM